MKLTYFDCRGLAEISRCILALAQVEYEDFRYPLIKTEEGYVKEEFEKEKEKYEFSMNKLPVLEHNGKTIPQSKAIERYLARMYGFMGKNETDAARIDAVCECVRDLRSNGENVSKQDLEKLVKVFDTGTQFAIGNKLSLADVTIYNFIVDSNKSKEFLEIAANNDRIRQIVMAVASRPEIIVWKQKRPNTQF